MRSKNVKKKPLTKRAYVYLGLVTMAAVCLFSKPIKRGFSALEKRLSSATAKTSLRHFLGLRSEGEYNNQFSQRVVQKQKRTNSRK